MFVADCLQVNEQGHLTIGGCDTVELAERYGTPLYVMDEETIRRNLSDYRRSIEENYENGGIVAYASKACAFKEMYRLVMSEGCAADVVSGGELYTAMQVGFPPERLYFHGNNKTDDELQLALEYGVGRIIVDNPSELRRLSAMAVAMGKTAGIYLRVTPGIDAHTHEFIRTGQNDSKFGFTLDSGEALEAVKAALVAPGVVLKGLHCHVGSQVFEESPFIHAAEVMLTFLNAIREVTGVTLGELNLGGGFGIRYLPEDQPKALGEYMRDMREALFAKAAELDFPMPYLVIEPGRSVVASSGITLYRVGYVKEIPGIRTYVSMDGGMADNPRYALYQAPYTVVVANKADAPVDAVYTVAGKCCESGDLIQENAPMQTCCEGDLLAVLATGAYNYSMSSNYNRLRRPPVVMITEGEPRVVVRGETYDDILKNDL